ncbi:2OG-Fe dioxygenase family protein [Streptomyces sp. NBC_00237]|uniref:2OG-Fe dioxygenase family protein n=1 Tax=Streptomyces sp. NBC_00237 TaxID=2975687 RepID=UPI00225227B5|nr:2OG-Fe dioxygenase family protein [Streptomyces sp. NBC_00237]MCX5205992.1 2OG-Fe dioxygenase family protein [Streptomyces sp. NBC_00237]
MGSATVEIHSPLIDAGFARYNSADLLRELPDSDADALFDRLRAAFASLPADPYAGDANRYRRYDRGVYVPWEGTFSWLPLGHDPVLGPVTEYYQGDHNPEHPGERRRFAALPPDVRSNALLREIIRFDAAEAARLAALSDGLLHVGVHFIKLGVESAEDEAVPSPNALHQDGEPFTFAHLISRDNVSGGVNVIAPPRCAGLRPSEISPALLQAEFTLENPLDSYGVYDPKVSHYVSPVRRGPEERRGERSILLVDFTPYVPHI